MGSRGRSIRLRIYFLVAIPLITMLGLFSYVAYTSVTNWLNLDRAPNLIRATSVPLTNFVSLLQAERRAAVVYLSHPDAANLNAYQTAITMTRNGELPLAAALTSAGTTTSTTAEETAAINKMTSDVRGMTPLRTAVTAKNLAPLDALAAYTKIIVDQDTVFQAQAKSIVDASAASQGLGLISAVNTREDLSEQDAVLAGALARGSLTGPDRVAFSQATGRQQDDTLLYQALLTPAELQVFNTTMNSLAPALLRSDLTTIQQAVPAGAPLRQMEGLGLSSPSWQQLTTAWSHANYTAATDAANAVLDRDQGLAIGAKRRVWETAAIGLAGLILTLVVTILLGRSINRRLTRLRRAALTLADVQLPAVVARLRRGESVDVAAEAPPLRVGSDEIGQVGQAIDAVRQTALRAAVEEARLRQGVNDVFRNLARRNQSLLQRQLTVLDGMERRASDPDVLEDLFKLDHLTTRMRRHAEGLIILSGSPPGRSWSTPVRLIDVMRGAIAEVEDYARVTVASQSKAALAGSAVTDVIHLLAELIENATTLSPPFTQVQVAGEIVANGFAIEIEDRGLGMTPARMAELNERLSNPPDVNPANTEQLGLFVVGQLARRHGISVTLRQSPYGGTTAVALIPRRLIVDEGPAAITAGGSGAVPRSAGPVARAAYAPSTVNGSPNGGGYGGMNGSYGPADTYGGPYAGSYRSNGGPGSPYPDQPFPSFTPSAPAGSGAPAGWQPDLEHLPGDQGTYGRTGAGTPRMSGSTGPSSSSGPTTSTGPMRVSGALRQSPPGAPATPGASPAQGGGSDAGAPSDRRRGRHGTSDVPVVTGVPVSRAAVPPGSSASSFDVFTPLRRAEPDSATAPADAHYGESYADYGGASQTQASYADAGYGNPSAGGSGSQDRDLESGGAEDYKGLPRRVRQANLAPQLRSSAAASSESTDIPQATAASLSDMRNTLSAMQRGWQHGRSQSQPDTEGSVDGG